MTNYPQQPMNGITRGMGDDRLADPSLRMILSMSPQDGAIKPLPADLSIQELANGSLRVTYPDRSVRELIPGAEGEGRMITTLADGTRIQSDLTMGDGQVTVASISSTGEKTFLSLNENGASMQRITPAGEISNVVPESAAELVQSFREVEAFTQAEEMREQEQFQENTEFGDWNNFGKPGDWQPEQNWQPPQGEFFQKPDYAGSNWVDAGNGSWIAPLQPDAFQQPQHWQPQSFDGGYNQPMYNQPPAASFGGPHFGGAQGIIDTNGYPQPPAAFMPPQQFGEQMPPAAFAPPQGNWQPPQSFDGGYNQPTYNQPPAAFAPPQGNWQPPATGFAPPPPTDASGFPITAVGTSAFGPAAAFTNASFEQVNTTVQSTDPLEVEDSSQQLPPQY